jgi:hypothetical protein
MLTSARSAFLHCSRTTSLTSRTAVYGPVRTVVWQGSAGDCRPYADQTGKQENCAKPRKSPVVPEAPKWESLNPSVLIANSSEASQ